MNQIKTRNIIKYCFYATIFLVVSILLFWKCKYGYATLDEAFYPTIAYRFMQGDRILFDEWSNTQLYAVLLMPLLKGYSIFKGSMDGVYLFIRYTYTVLKIILSAIVFLCIRKKFDVRKSFIVTLIFLIFAEYGMMVISYNSVAAGGFVLFLMLLFCADDGVWGDVLRIIAGICLSICVLGIPYMAILYILMAIAVIAIARLKKIDSIIKNYYSFRNFIFITIGVVISAALYMMYVFSKVSFGQILQTLPHILNGDPAHKQKNIYQLTLAYFVRIATCNNRNKLIFALYVIIFAVCVFLFVNRKKKLDYSFWNVIPGLAGIILLSAYITTNNYINDVIFIPNVVAFMIALYATDKRIEELFWCVWIPGMAFTYMEYLASNTGYSGISAASCVAAIGSILIILCEAENNKTNLKSVVSYGLFIVITLVALLYYRSTYVFWENGITSLTTTINGGTADGLATTPENAEHYYKIISETKDIRELEEEKRVLFAADKVLWMNGKQKCGSYSPLCYSISDTRSILYDYYEEHPDMLPDAIYIEKTYGEETINDIAQTMNCMREEREVGVILTPRKK